MNTETPRTQARRSTLRALALGTLAALVALGATPTALADFPPLLTTPTTLGTGAGTGPCYDELWQPGYAECWGWIVIGDGATGTCYGHWYVDHSGNDHYWCQSGDLAPGATFCVASGLCYGVVSFHGTRFEGRCFGSASTPSGGNVICVA